METGVKAAALLGVTLAWLAGAVQAQAASPAPAAAAAAAPAASASTPALVTQAAAVQALAKAAIDWGDFPLALEGYQRYRQSGLRTADGGRLDAIYLDGLSTSAHVAGARHARTAQQYEHLLARYRGWAAAYPQEPLAHWLVVQGLVAYAWWYRGEGYANTVPAQAWTEINRLLKQAQEHLAQHRAVALQNPALHMKLIQMGRLAGWDTDRLWAIAQDGLQRDPGYVQLYHAVLVSHLPKWGGDSAAMARFIDEAARATQAEWGEALYAMLYSDATEQQYEQRVLTESGVRWPRMRQGFRDLLQRYPLSQVWPNRMAYFACLAADRNAYQEARARMGPTPLWNEWGSNPRPGYETCLRWSQQP